MPLSLRAALLRIGLVAGLAATLLAGCAGYYLQAAAGQAELLRAREPLETVLADPRTPLSVRRHLLAVDEALVFARVQLGLPASSSYRHYADLKRPYVVWNVFAAPEFSLEPHEWCYPVAGCVAYRGWFSEERARASAAELQEKGDDVFIGGVAAYSTLGWFPDPVLSTMLGGQDEDVAGLLIHELAHQRYYASGDTLFNEGFATLVEEEGTRRWLESRRDAAGLCRFHLRQARRAAALGVISALRGELTVIYASALSDDQRRQQRAAAYGNAQEAYARLRAGWSGPPWFDAWFAPGLNNARLAALSSYEDYVPGFRALLAQSDGDLERFYASVEELGRRKPAERDQRLQELSGEPDAAVSAAPPSGTCP